MSTEWCCPICHAPHVGREAHLRVSCPEGPLNIYRCACGLCYSERAVGRAAPDVYGESYYDHPRYAAETGRRAYVEHLARFFRQAANGEAAAPDRRLLDVGCATGDFVAWAQKEGWRAEGVDIAQCAVSEGLGRGLTLRVANVESLVAERETYDVITMWDVLEHLPDTSRALAAIRTALKPTGLMLLKTVSCTSLVDRLARAISRATAGMVQGPLRRIYVPGHLYYYTRQALRRYLTQEGWRVVLEAQTDTPAEALFRPGLIRLAFRAAAAVQALTGHRYELLAACRKA